MARLRSARGDRWLIASLWLLTAAVLAVGIAAGAVILLVWGAVGLPGAAFVTYVYLRDQRAAAAPPPAVHTARGSGEAPREEREPLEEETS